MHWSKLFIPTLREDPAHAESDAHRLLIRAGYIRVQSSGVYHYLFAAQRALLKIQTVAREEMASIGAQEFSLADAQPIAEAPDETANNGTGGFTPALSIRSGRSLFALEDIAREIQSYREFPQIWYQQNGSDKTQHSFSLDLSREGLSESFEKHHRGYARILARCGVAYIDAGGDFMAPSNAGKDSIVIGNNYAAHLENASGVPLPPSVPDPEGDFSPEELHTPGIGTIADLAAFTGLPETSHIKTLVRLSEGKPVMVLLRGDHQLSEAKLAQALATKHLSTPNPESLRQWLGADAGSLGPVGVANMPVLIDEALRDRRNMIAGANRNGYHLRHLTPGEDFEGRFVDVRQVLAGDASITDGAPLRIEKATRLAALRKLPGDFGDPARPLALGHYRLWIEQILIAAAGSNRDKDGLTLKPSIAPFTIVIVPIDYNAPELRRAAEDLYRSARAAGLDVVLDDRDLRAGVKFKDADLVGIPYRINVGKKLTQGMVEVVARSPKQTTDVPISEAVAFVTAALAHANTPH